MLNIIVNDNTFVNVIINIFVRNYSILKYIIDKQNSFLTINFCFFYTIFS